MKKILTTVALSALVCSSVFAQTVLRPHFTEESKRIVVPRWASVSPEIHEGMIVVHDYPKVYYVNLEGEYVFGSEFPFTRGHDSRTPYFSGGAMMAWRTKPGAFSPSPFIIYPNGTFRDLPDDITGASSFVDGHAIVWKGRSVVMGVRQIFIDKNGREVFPALTSTQRGTFGDITVYPLRENRRVFYNAELKKYGYADARGNIVIQPTFDKALNFSEGLAAVMTKEPQGDRWGFIDLTGKLVIPATYRLMPGRFSEGLAAVRIGSSEYDYEMAYIDKTGKRVIENKPWNLNEFHNGYAWVGTGCEKLFVWDREFKEVRDITEKFYHGGNGFGTCMFSMVSGHVDNRVWGFDFPNGMQMLNQSGVQAGAIFAPNGTIVFSAVDADGDMVLLHNVTEGGLMFCQVMMRNQPQLRGNDVYLPVFINQKGEIIYYFVEGVEGFEGRKPTQIK